MADDMDKDYKNQREQDMQVSRKRQKKGKILEQLVESQRKKQVDVLEESEEDDNKDVNIGAPN
jgi:hypothetical protein